MERQGKPLSLLVWLTAPAELEVVVHRLSDCRPVGRLETAGRTGRNAIRFRARVGTRTLAPGAYVLRVRREAAPAGSFFRVPVRVVERRREPGLAVVLAPRTQRCEEEEEAWTSLSGAIGISMGTVGAEARDGDPARSSPAVPDAERETGGEATPVGVEPPDAEAPEAEPGAEALTPGAELEGTAGELPLAFGIAALVLLVGSFLFILGYVARFLRRPG